MKKNNSDLLEISITAENYYGNPTTLAAIIGGVSASLLISIYFNLELQRWSLIAMSLIEICYLIWFYLYFKAQKLNILQTIRLGRVVGIGLALSWPAYLVALAKIQNHSSLVVDMPIIYNIVLLSIFPSLFRYDYLVARLIVVSFSISLLIISYLKFNDQHWIFFSLGSLIYASFIMVATESRLKAETKLKKDQRRLEQIFDAFPGGVSLLKDLKYKTVNKYLRDHLPKNQDLENRPLGYYNPNNEWVIKIKDFASSSDKQIVFESTVFTNSGPRIFLTSATKIAPDEIVLISIDIQELANARQELEAQKARNLANAKLVSLGEMSAGIAHEINNPLAILKGRITLLEKAIQIEPLDRIKIQEHVNKLMPVIERIAKIVQSMRKLCRTGNLDTDLRETSVRKIVEEALFFMEARLKNYGAELRITGDGLDSTIMAVESQMTQVLVNALANSHDAIQNSKNKWIEIEVLAKTSEIVLLIKDSGPGIPEKERDKVGQPFFTTKEPGKGTGLGLSISRTIVEKHGGTLEFDYSTPVTTLKITLPKAKPATQAA